MGGSAEAELHGWAQWPLGASVWPACAGCCSTSRACCTTAVRAAASRSPAPWRRWRGEWAALAVVKAGQPGVCSRLWPLPGPGRGGAERGGASVLALPAPRRPEDHQPGEDQPGEDRPAEDPIAARLCKVPGPVPVRAALSSRVATRHCGRSALGMCLA